MIIEKTEDNKFVSELVWLPTYIMVAIFVFSRIDNAALAILAIFAVPIGIRVVLEIFYRALFGVNRLTLKIGILAFLSQVFVWGGFVFWFDQQ